jgi:serine protease Do
MPAENLDCLPDHARLLLPVPKWDTHGQVCAMAAQNFLHARLVKRRPARYRWPMLKPSALLLALLGCGMLPVTAEVIQLRDSSSITGKILVQKRDQVIVDIGYTVLDIPTSQIVKISKTAGAETPAVASPTPPPAVETRSGIYQTANTPPPIKDVRELVAQLGEAVVQVSTPGGLGSGFIINADGFLITNFHVIEGETEISVEVYHQNDGQLERKTYKDVRIIAINKFADIALLKIEDKDKPRFSRVVIGDSEMLAVGESVFAIGSPLGLERTVTEGIVSTKTRELQGDLYLQTTTQINPGNSGGPLFNLRGEVVGITNMKIVSGEGLGFAIPISAVKYFLDHRDAFAYSNDNPSNPYRYLPPPRRTGSSPQANDN